MRRAIALLLAGCLQPPLDISVHGSPDLDGPIADLAVAAVDLGVAAAAADLGGADLATAAADLAHPLLKLGALCLDSATPPSATDDCAAGTSCARTSSSSGATLNYCEQDCNADSDCTQPPIAGGLKPVCEPPSCTLSCDPAGATDGTHGCPAGTACEYFLHMVSGTFTEATSCILVGTLGEGAACNDSPDTCAAGLACIIPVSGPAACRRICRLGSSAGCKTGQSCQGPFPALLTSPVFGACT